MNRIKFTILTLILLLSYHSYGQKVGLVLSGGGAKGLYHVGVIKALEQNNIPIDYVSGTSMGAIVGGLYAIGFTPDQMEQEFLSDQVKYWMTGKIQEKYGYYFKAMKLRPSMLNVQIDHKKNDGFSALMPSNIIPSNQIDLAFIEYFSGASVACNDDFDQLFVPFRCVATDATKKKEVIFKDGDLGYAIRASMSIPLVFSALSNDSTTFYDGGMFNNFPWQVVREDFQPDIIIGSSCADANDKPSDNSMMDQVLNLTMMHTDYTIPDSLGLVVNRVIDDVSIMSFDKAAYIMDLGYQDAMAVMDQIQERVRRRVDPKQLEIKRLAFRKKKPLLIFEDANINELYMNQTEYVKKILKLNHDEPFTFNQFKSEFFKLLAENEVDMQYPNVVFNDSTQRFILNMDMSVKPKFKVRIGGNISSTALNQAYLGFEYKRMGLSIQHYNLDLHLSPFYTSIWAGSRIDIMTKRPFYIEGGGMYNNSNYFRSNYGLISKSENLSYSKYSDMYGTLVGGFPLSRHSVFNVRFNVAADRFHYDMDYSGGNSSKILEYTRFNFVSSEIEIDRNTTNYILYPTGGILQNISLMSVDGREWYTPGDDGGSISMSPNTQRRSWYGFRFVREHYMGVGDKQWFSWGYLTDLCLTNHPEFSTEQATNLTSPAFTPTQHSKLIYLKEFRSRSFLALGVMPIFKFTPSFYFKTGCYAFLPDTNMKEIDKILPSVKYIFDGALVYQTIVGPVSISLSKYDVTTKGDWFINFNLGYALFNKRGLIY